MFFVSNTPVYNNYNKHIIIRQTHFLVFYDDVIYILNSGTDSSGGARWCGGGGNGGIRSRDMDYVVAVNQQISTFFVTNIPNVDPLVRA